MEAAAWVGAIGSFIAGIAAAAAVAVAQNQLKNLNRSLRHSTVVSVVQLETEMNSRKLACDAAAKELRFLIDSTDSSPIKIEATMDYLQGCKESWYNAVDRLAFFIIHKYVKEREMRPEYEPYLRSVVAEAAELFTNESPYQNIVTLAKRWKILTNGQPSSRLK